MKYYIINYDDGDQDYSEFLRPDLADQYAQSTANGRGYTIEEYDDVFEYVKNFKSSKEGN